jgi:hypothetical protein
MDASFQKFLMVSHLGYGRLIPCRLARCGPGGRCRGCHRCTRFKDLATVSVGSDRLPELPYPRVPNHTLQWWAASS